MTFDPDVQLILEMMRLAGRPPFEALTPDEARQAYTASRAVLSPEPQPVAETRDLSCPGPHGDIALRYYRPAGTEPGQVLPVLVYFHGGGWLLGGLDSHDSVCRHFANAARCAVVSVDYRMAPEHKFPAAVDDSEAATRWIVAHAAALGIDLSAQPGYADILAARADRMAVMRRIVAGLTAADLARQCQRSPAPGYPEEERTVIDCISVVMDEEMEHYRFAVRDLAVLEAS